MLQQFGYGSNLVKGTPELVLAILWRGLVWCIPKPQQARSSRVWQAVSHVKWLDMLGFCWTEWLTFKLQIGRWDSGFIYRGYRTLFNQTRNRLNVFPVDICAGTFRSFWTDIFQGSTKTGSRVAGRTRIPVWSKVSAFGATFSFVLAPYFEVAEVVWDIWVSHGLSENTRWDISRINHQICHLNRESDDKPLDSRVITLSFLDMPNIFRAQDQKFP